MAAEERLRQLLLDIGEEMTQEDLQDIKFKQGIPAGRNQKITKPIKLWYYYEKRGQIEYEDEKKTLINLKKILDLGPGNVRLKRLVERYEKKYRTATAAHQLPGARRDVTTAMAQISLSDQASAAPGSAESVESKPAAARLSAPPRSAGLAAPLPLHVNYQEKRARGPVRMVDLSMPEGYYFLDASHLTPRGCAYHASTDSLYVAACYQWGHGPIVKCCTHGETCWLNSRLCEVYEPHDVAVSGDGDRVYVISGFRDDSSLHILTASGDQVRDPVTSVPGGKMGYCYSVTCYQQQVAVLTEDFRVIIFSRDGGFVRLWRVGGVWCRGMAVDGDGHVYITDNNTGAVVVYSWEGEFRERFGEVGMKNPDSPGICVDGDGNVCVSRSDAHRVDVYDRQRRIFTSLGDERGNAPGQFDCPHGLCLLPDGRLVVSDCHNHRLQIF